MLDNFQISKKIKEDKLGIICIAEQIHTKKQVIIKKYKPKNLPIGFLEIIEQENKDLNIFNLHKNEKELYVILNNKKGIIKKLQDLEIYAIKLLRSHQEKNIDNLISIESDLQRNTNKNKKTNWKRKFLIIILSTIFIGIGFAVLENFVFKYLTAISEVRVPVLENKNIDEAKTILKELELEGIVVAHIPNPNIEKNCVISSYPEADNIVKVGRKIRLKVSLGRTRIKVPSLVGRDPHQINPLMKRNNLHLAINKNKSKYDKTVPRGKILHQSISPNVLVLEGTTINVVLSKGFPVKLSAKKDTSTDNHYQIKLNCFVLPEWEKTKVKSVITIPPDESLILFEEEIIPGGAINKQFEEEGSAIIEIFYDDELAFKQTIRKLATNKEND